MSKLNAIQRDFKDTQLKEVKESGSEITNLLQAILVTLEEILVELKGSIII